MFGMTHESSTFTALLSAVLKSLNIVCPLTRRVVVCKNSLSTLKPVQDDYPKHILIQKILAVHNERVRGIDVVFVRVPGYVILPGIRWHTRQLLNCSNLLPSASTVVAPDLILMVKSRLNEK